MGRTSASVDTSTDAPRTDHGSEPADTPDFDRRTFWLAQIAVWGAFGAVTFLTFLGQIEPGQVLGLAILKLGVRPVLGMAASTILMLGYRRWLEDRGGTSRPGWAAATVVVACTVFGAVWYLSTHAVFSPLLSEPAPIDWARFPRAVLEYIVVLLAWSAGYLWVRSRQVVRRKERQALRASASARAAQLEVLAYQLDPHFLFNALTSLRGLIHDDPARAEIVVGRLAAFLRRTLARPALGTSTLAEELSHTEAYLEVERSRHGDDLRVDIDVEPAAERAGIPTFLLHPLVENAVKHGRAPESGPKRIVLRAALEGDRLRVEIANPGSLERRRRSDAVPDSPGRRHRPSANPDGTGVGLRNVRRRLEHHAPGHHRLRLTEDDGWVRAVLEIDQTALAASRDGAGAEAAHA